MTTWHPYTNVDPAEYLLANGEIVTPPLMEVSEAGRRIRLVDDPNTRAYTKDVDKLMLEGAKLVARRRGTKLWMKVNHKPRLSALSVADDRIEEPTIRLQTNGVTDTRVWWHFRHDSLPIHAFVTLSTDTSWRNTVVHSSIKVPVTMYQHVLEHEWVEPNTLPAAASNGATRQVIEDALRTEAFDVYRELAASFTFPRSSRKPIGTLLDLALKIDDLAELPVLDLRDPDEPDVLMLPLLETSFTTGFRQSLVDFVDGTPLLEKAQEAYQQLRAALSQMGVTLGDEDALGTLLASGDDMATLTLGPVMRNEDDIDTHHVLHAHPATGTLYVQCSKDSNDMNQVAERWEEAKTLASLTGESDALRAFAMEYGKKQASIRSREIANSRDPR